MAIITRWRMPPENWWGYWIRRFSASGMPTSAQQLDHPLLRPLFYSSPGASISGSETCFPMVMTGLSEVIGS